MHAPAIRRSFGYNLSNYNTLDKVNDVLLARELLIKNIQCEFPGCSQIAFGIIKTGVTAFVCAEHCQPSMSQSAQIKIKSNWQTIMTRAANAAWEGTDDAVSSTFSGEGSILDGAAQQRQATVSQPPRVIPQREITKPTEEEVAAMSLLPLVVGL